MTKVWQDNMSSRQLSKLAKCILQFVLFGGARFCSIHTAFSRAHQHSYAAHVGKIIRHVILEFPSATQMLMVALWAGTPCGLGGAHQRFKGTRPNPPSPLKCWHPHNKSTQRYCPKDQLRQSVSSLIKLKLPVRESTHMGLTYVVNLTLCTEWLFSNFSRLKLQGMRYYGCRVKEKNSNGPTVITASNLTHIHTYKYILIRYTKHAAK
jgi:hypothetical protein